MLVLLLLGKKRSKRAGWGGETKELLLPVTGIDTWRLRSSGGTRIQKIAPPSSSPSHSLLPLFLSPPSLSLSSPLPLSLRLFQSLCQTWAHTGRRDGKPSAPLLHHRQRPSSRRFPGQRVILHRRSGRSDTASPLIRPHSHPLRPAERQWFAPETGLLEGVWDGEALHWTSKLTPSRPTARSLSSCALFSFFLFFPHSVGDSPANGRNSTVVAAYCLHVDVRLATMWRLLHPWSCCWWICSVLALVLVPACALPRADCRPGEFAPFVASP